MFGRTLAAALVVLGAGWGAGPASAEPEDLNRGKTPAQFFASDCADCHRNPRGLAKRNANSLTGFLRVHYTASKESAAAIAAYLVSLGPDPRAGSSRPAERPRTTPAVKPKETAQPSAKPSEAPKPSEPAKPVETAEPATPAPAVAAPPASAAPASSEALAGTANPQ